MFWVFSRVIKYATVKKLLCNVAYNLTLNSTISGNTRMILINDGSKKILWYQLFISLGIFLESSNNFKVLTNFSVLKKLPTKVWVYKNAPSQFEQMRFQIIEHDISLPFTVKNMKISTSSFSIFISKLQVWETIRFLCLNYDHRKNLPIKNLIKKQEVI